MAGLRQPIVALLGHVDHGKTSLLDHIRGLRRSGSGTVQGREAGGITQHIGATEVPADLLNEICAPQLGGAIFESPGLLFIDTPGHHAFTSLRSRGGALADLAIVIVDIMEGLQPQTIESLRILRQFRTPFVLAANKIDRLYGWEAERGRSFAQSWRAQDKDVQELFQERYWKMVGQIAEHGFDVERYDTVTDFTQTVAMCPCSAKEGEGIQDLLTVTVGLAEKFLTERLSDTEGPAKGTVLEVKRERGLGMTADVILHHGSLAKGDEVVFVGEKGPVITKLRGMFRPRLLTEMRDAGDRWQDVKQIDAAAGVKLSGPDLEGVLAGTMMRGFTADSDRSEILAAARAESDVSIELADDGLVVKADTAGGLEALAFELAARAIPVRAASVGEVTKRDLREAEHAKDPLHRLILGFSTDLLPEVAKQLDASEVHWIRGEVIYGIMDEMEAWRAQVTRSIAEASRETHVYPGRFILLKDHVFRTRHPAVVGIRVLGGRLRVGQRVMKPDGSRVGKVRSLRKGEANVDEAREGDELAVAIEGPTVGRQIDEEDMLLVDIPEDHARKLQHLDLTASERDVLEEILRLHRKVDHFWGR